MNTPTSSQLERTEAADSPIGARVTSGTVHDVLRQRILMGELKPGSEISQLELSRQLSVSRTPLREALKLLEREGLVISNGPHRLVTISPLSMIELDDLYSLRVLGEALAISLTLPTMRDDDFERLQSLVELMERGDEDAHARFHASLRSGAGDRLQDHLARLYDHAERYRRAFLRQDQQTVERKWKEHRAILDAVLAGDQVRSRDALVDHVAGTAVTLMAAERHAPYSLPAAVAMAKASRT